MKKETNTGLTVLELLITLAIIAIVATTAPNFFSWTKRYGYKNTYHHLEQTLSSLRSEALSQNTSTRLVVENNGNAYTLHSYVTPTPVSSCDSSGGWTDLSSEALSIPSSFQVTGDGVSGVCFYRDGSASGGTFNITQKNGGTDIGSATITVIVATGYLDVTASQ